jgi:xanthine phosphoribosyltransferase
MQMGEAFVARFLDEGVRDITRVVTAEVSGIAPAMATARVLGVPMIYARKHRPITMREGEYVAEATSPTKGGQVELIISPEYLGETDRVLLIDDFLASGVTIEALVKLIRQSGAVLCGIGCVIEKVYAGGRDHLAYVDVPIVTLAKVDLQGGQMVVC